ncbi:MAG: glycine cleavage system protein T [Bacteroides sp. SM23_62]|nr:MAG: glycine cleavage system protein T [Bacteroides sp. SM23_62]
MKDTALTGVHRELGARIVPFAGYNMPVEYTGVKDEHVTVRNAVGVFDVSHMGEIWVRGPQAARFIQRVTTNDVHKLYVGRIQYTCFPNGRGGIVDDLLVYQVADEHFLMVVNAANIEKDWDWLNEQNTVGAELENASDQTAQLAVQGPKATETLQKLTNLDLGGIAYYTFLIDSFAGVEDVIISATGYTGAGGFELYFQAEEAVKIWNAVMEAGREFGIKPVGLAARDTLRLEMGFCLYGNDIDETTSPIEAGLGWITKFTENNDFIDRERLQQQKSEGVKRKLVGFTMVERGIPRQHYEILDGEGSRIGEVTSGTMSPSMNIGIGMGYVAADYAVPGQEILIRIRNKRPRAVVVQLPIYQKE